MKRGRADDRAARCRDVWTPRARRWRGDLAVALVTATDRGDARAAAEILGFSFDPAETPKKPPPDRGESRLSAQRPPDSPVVPTPTTADVDWSPIPFWQLEEIEYFPEDAEDPEFDDRPDNTHRVTFERPNETDWEKRPQGPPLASWAVVGPRLWQHTGQNRPTRRIDIDAWVRAVSRAELELTIPRRHRRTWPASLLVLIDRSDRLIPFWRDQDRVVADLERWCGEHAVETELLSGSVEQWRPPVRATNGAMVLALSDLGVYASSGEVERWRRAGRHLRRAGCSLAALVPVPRRRLPADVARLWSVVRWARSAGLLDQTEEARRVRAESLLAHLAPAMRIEPGLIRVALQALGAPAGDVGTEADAWNHDALVATTSVGAVWAKKDRADWFARFRTIADKAVAKAMADALTHFHADWLPPEVRRTELLALLELDASLVNDDDAAEARRFSELLLGSLRAGDARHRGQVAPYARRMVRRWLPTEALDDDSHIRGDRARNPLARIAALVQAEDAQPRFGKTAHPKDLEAASGEHPPRTFTLLQRGDGLVMKAPSTEGASRNGDSPLGFVTSRRLLAHITGLQEAVAVGPDQSLVVSPAAATRIAVHAPPPPWAKRVGRDKFGLYAEVEVKGVSFRMRWIDPGMFWMGSPDDEPGRRDYEIRHQVTLTQGYWMAESPCTQALWTAVMGENPSRFQTPNRPVEHVSWHNATAFCARLNELIPQLDVRLPTEAEWEHACRSGTETATYAGPIEILGRDNAPILDDIAIYSGNSGVGFELDNGQDNTDWEKQYEDGPAGSHPVGLKRPNAWGLLDTLGNVFEWCSDYYGPYASEAISNPSGPVEGTLRVLRGGSWVSDARRVRAASRYANVPSLADGDIGFRLSRGQAPGEGRPAAEPTVPVRTGRRDAEPDRPRVHLITDQMAAQVAVIERPSWATAIGRDRFGLWTEVEVLEDVAFRLRWIPPGRFMMGSPPKEEGRYDSETQHEVTLTRGYWFAETPCTQALWTAVMHDNPSRFRSPGRPVERVSWKDCQRFLNTLNDLIPGLDAGLPTEAEWEHACRAGRMGATHAGDLTFRTVRDSPELDAIAWYSGNCGVDFDLSEGEDMSGEYWSGKQYNFTTGGTRAVGQKQRNAWGLHDMLGNVKEWCHDYWERDLGTEAAVDPTGASNGGPRVIRGGSWNYSARGCRAASRRRLGPSLRSPSLGFRLARGQARAEPAHGKVDAEPAARRSPGAERPRVPEGESTEDRKRTIRSRVRGVPGLED